MYWSDFWKFDFLGQKSVVVAEIWSFSAIFGHFSATTTDFDPKNQIFKNLINTYFFNHFYLQLGQISSLEDLKISRNSAKREMSVSAI